MKNNYLFILIICLTVVYRMGAVGGLLRENYYTVLRTENNNKLNIKKYG